MGSWRIVKIVALSDTHGHHREVTLPPGDVFVYAGDFMTCGYKFNEVRDFADWINKLPHTHKILVAGNHDRLMEQQHQLCINQFDKSIHYLKDSSVTINGLKFWGSPYTPWFYNWAFNVHRGPSIKAHWDKIPTDTDVLITHGPPYGILDQSIPHAQVSSWSSTLIIPSSEHVGCEELKYAVERIMPEIHIFGHIHGSYGQSKNIETRFFNVSTCNEQYNPGNDPIVIEI